MGNTIPEIFVLWHPSCRLGEDLARCVYGWLRPGCGLGPRVFYRCLEAPGSPADRLPLPLPGEPRFRTTKPNGGADEGYWQILLLLIDEHMIADADWRGWIGQLASEPETDAAKRRTFLPVVLDSTAFNAPENLRVLNFLRPAGLPVPRTEWQGRGAAMETVVRSLLKQLTEALGRMMLGGAQSSGGRNSLDLPSGDIADQLKLLIFLSHAKVDGTAPTKRIRDYIYSRTQLAAFYDENDIPFGSAFGRVLDANIKGGCTVAMIAIRSAAYASRPWCRRELAQFRRPRKVGGEGLAEHWRLSPLLVVDAMEAGSQTEGIPEMGNASLIRWAEEIPEQEEQIVTTLLRDALLASFHTAVGRRLIESGDADAEESVVLNWRPDPTTLLYLLEKRAASRGRREAEKGLRVFYPGADLSRLELGVLREFFPRLELLSFETVTS